MTSVNIEFYRLTELRLQTQVELAKARDQKAVSLATLAAAATAFSAGLVGPTVGYGAWTLGATVCFAVSSAMLALCSMPQSFAGLGYRFSTLNIPELVPLSYDDLLIELAYRNDTYIESNRRQSDIVTGIVRLGILLFSLGIILIIPAAYEIVGANK